MQGQRCGEENGDRDVAQLAECLPGRHKDLGSISSTPNQESGCLAVILVLKRQRIRQWREELESSSEKVEANMP